MLGKICSRFTVEDSSYSSCLFRAQMKLSKETPQAITHLTCSHIHCTLISTGPLSLLKEAIGKSTSNHFWTQTSVPPSVPLWLCQSCHSETDRSLFKMHQSPTLQQLNEKATIISDQNKSYSATFGRWRKWKLWSRKPMYYRLDQRQSGGVRGGGMCRESRNSMNFWPVRGQEGPGPGPSLMWFCCWCNKDLGTVTFAYVKKRRNLGLKSKRWI